VIGAGPSGLTAVKNLLQAGCRDVVCYDEGHRIGGNWAYTDDPGRVSVYESAHTISSRRLSSFDDFPMPEAYPDFPSHRQLLAYFADYARTFGLDRHVRLGARVERCRLREDGRWLVRVVANGTTTTETFDALLVCSGHHRQPVIPRYPGTFSGRIVHSSGYKRPEVWRGKRVLVVGAGNSAADIAVDLARVASRVALSMREGAYVVPKLVFGRPADVVYAFWRRWVPLRLLRSALRLWLRFAVGRWERYGLAAPVTTPLAKPPIVNAGLLAALRDGRVVARRGIERYDGRTVHFVDGTGEEFDAIVMATGFRVWYPFLPEPVVDRDTKAPPPLYLRMMHPTVPNVFFIGLFQPIGCIWRLADHQARIAALQISGRLPRPADIDARIRRQVAEVRRQSDPVLRHGIEVDYHTFGRELTRTARFTGATPPSRRRSGSGC